MFSAPFIVPEMGYDICPPRFHIGNLSHGGVSIPRSIP